MPNRKGYGAKVGYLFATLHDNRVEWRTDAGLSGSDPYRTLSELETIIFNLKKRYGLRNDQVEVRNERTRRNPRRAPSASILAAHARGVKARKNPAGGVRIVFNRLLGGWYIVRGPHQTPLGGRFDSKEDAQAHLRNQQAARDSRSPRYVRAPYQNPKSFTSAQKRKIRARSNEMTYLTGKRTRIAVQAELAKGLWATISTYPNTEAGKHAAIESAKGIHKKVPAQSMRVIRVKR